LSFDVGESAGMGLWPPGHLSGWSINGRLSRRRDRLRDRSSRGTSRPRTSARPRTIASCRRAARSPSSWISFVTGSMTTSTRRSLSTSSHLPVSERHSARRAVRVGHPGADAGGEPSGPVLRGVRPGTV